MLPQRLDTTLAHKAVALTPELSGMEKRVASAIIDSFNRRTGQCDPSFDRIVHLLGISRRSVIRAIRRLEALRFIQKFRHGGKSHRNAYQPNWALYRSLDNAWSARQKTRHWDSAPQEPPLWCQGAGASGVETGTQTIFLKNQKNKTSSSAAEGTTRNWQSLASPKTADPVKQKAAPHVSHTAAVTAAERRWYGDIHKRYANNKEIYARILDAITPELASGATQAEVNSRGAGLAYIEHALASAEIGRSTDVKPEESNDFSS